MCEIDIDDPCIVWNEKWRRAAREHKCCVCHGVIHIGESHLHHTHIAERGDKPRSMRACAVCGTLHARFFSEHNGGFPPDDLMEALWSCVEGSEYDRTIKEDAREWRTAIAIIKKLRRRAKKISGNNEETANASGP
jgi:hypothetical protein